MVLEKTMAKAMVLKIDRIIDYMDKLIEVGDKEEIRAANLRRAVFDLKNTIKPYIIKKKIHTKTPYDIWRDKNINEITILSQDTGRDRDPGFSLEDYAKEVYMSMRPNELFTQIKDEIYDKNFFNI